VSEQRGFDKIIGQNMAKQVLGRAMRTDEPCHAYLFVGLEGTGKCATAVEFAKALNCENPTEHGACGACAVCHAIEHGNFPDLRIWSPDGQNTKIEAMREMRDLAVFRPMRGRWKLNIVEQGDTLREESANCILKLVEEPPEYLINILLYRNAANVLPTIRSRCQLVRFTQVNTDELAARLAGEFHVEQKEAEFLATYSQGRPGIAIGLIGNDEFFKRRDAVIAAAAGACSGNRWLALKSAEMLRSANGSFAAASDGKPPSSYEDEDEPEEAPAQSKPKKKPASRDAVMESLDMLLVWYRDLLAAKLQGPEASIVNSDRRDDVIAQSRVYQHAGRLANAVEAIMHAKRGILGNANAQISTESLIMRLRQ